MRNASRTSTAASFEAPRRARGRLAGEARAGSSSSTTSATTSTSSAEPSGCEGPRRLEAQRRLGRARSPRRCGRARRRAATARGRARRRPARRAPTSTIARSRNCIRSVPGATPCASRSKSSPRSSLSSLTSASQKPTAASSSATSGGDADASASSRARADRRRACARCRAARRGRAPRTAAGAAPLDLRSRAAGDGQPELARRSGAGQARVEGGREAALVGDHEPLAGLLRVGEAGGDADDLRRHLRVREVQRQRAARPGAAARSRG